MSISLHENKSNNTIEAVSNNFIEIKDTHYRSKLQATFEKIPEGYYTSLEFILESPSSRGYFKKFNDIGTYDIVDFFKKNLSEEVSAGFAYPKTGEGILLTSEEINAIYVPLLKSINNHITKSR